ncbi:MAG: hypothetical protein GXY86_07005 [Firmicutes bacterium]|nr:hypothetical protein [Bacillota bacterium]
MKKRVLSMLFIASILMTLFVMPQNIHASNEFMLGNSSFNNATYPKTGWASPWVLYQSPDATANGYVTTTRPAQGKYHVKVTHPGINNYDIQFRHQNLVLLNGVTYTWGFEIKSSIDVTLKGAALTWSDEPWFPDFDKTPKLKLKAGQVVKYSRTFTMKQDYKQAHFVVYLSDLSKIERDSNNKIKITPYTITMDNFSLTGGANTQRPKPRTISPFRVNFEGYIPDGKKTAILVDSSTSPLDWQLKNSNKVLASGFTTVLGTDTSSGDHLHLIDFSSFNDPSVRSAYLYAKNGTLKCPDQINMTYDLYEDLKYDALNFFYQQRSGIAINLPLNMGLRRPAGHVDQNGNPSDIGEPVSDEIGNAFLVNQGYQKSDYGSINAAKGWYDAGDHGKYVPSGALALWLMHNQYERTLQISGAKPEAYANGTMRIPENKNSYPDILDEARWEMEMLLGMQIKSGVKKGMVHHKFHDTVWAMTPKKPSDNKLKRVAYPPSTSATLAFAAVAAQSYRLWKNLDKSFANTCLTAAKDAWDAAEKYPNEYTRTLIMDDTDGYDGRKENRVDYGGGYYECQSYDSEGEIKVQGDNTDELFWAACELYLATGGTSYSNVINNSKHFGWNVGLKGVNKAGEEGPFDWRDTAALGSLSLALVGTNSNYQSIAKYQINNYANAVLNVMKGQKYPVPITKYYWGSNSSVLNRAIILAYAYDLNYRNKQYLDGVTQCLDYLLGTNANFISYVTSDMTNSSFYAKNPHHRFWAKQVNPDYPSPPPGVILGGPCQVVEDYDDFMKETEFPRSNVLVGNTYKRFADVYPQKCYIDHCDAYACNEVAVNWNAALAWVAGFVDEAVNYDITPPAAPWNLKYTSRTSTTISLQWDPTWDNKKVAKYQVYQNGTLVSSISYLTYNVKKLKANTTYRFTVRAVDLAGNISGHSSPLTVTTLP